MADYKSKLHQMTVEFPIDSWNDSCSESELKYAIDHGAVGRQPIPRLCTRSSSRNGI